MEKYRVIGKEIPNDQAYGRGSAWATPVSKTV